MRAEQLPGQRVPITVKPTPFAPLQVHLLLPVNALELAEFSWFVFFFLLHFTISEDIAPSQIHFYLQLLNPKTSVLKD